MNTEATNSWYLQKHEDETLFGPITLDQLRQWAIDAQVSPLDKVSQDGTTWVKAPTSPPSGFRMHCSALAPPLPCLASALASCTGPRP